MRIRIPAILFLLLVAGSLPLSAADVTGRWTGQMVLGVSAHTIPFTLDLKIEGSDLSGMLCARDCRDSKSQPILNPTINGDNISFSVATEDPGLPRINFQGTVSGDAIKFVLNGSPADCPMASCQVGDATATRAK